MTRRASADVLRRALPIGPEPVAGGVHFRVWAPDASRVDVVLEGAAEPFELEAEEDGYFSGLAPGAGAGARYRLRLDGGETFPDPASPFQPEGPHGPSEVVDHAAYPWRDAAWAGPRPDDAVLYELHAGTFTTEGTWRAAAARLPELARLGVTMIEVMPANEFAGTFGWGYDGVDWFAPSRLYGRPEDLMRFVDEAHRLGVAVLLDVVYNHFGPVGHYLGRFAKAYMSERYRTDWGPAVNYDGPGSGPVREHVVSNVRHWISRYRLDGLRFDATQNVYDTSGEHILAEATRAARAAAGKRRVFLVAENEPQRARLLRPIEAGGYGFDAIWSDDFHHAAEVALTGRREGYYEGFRGEPQELVSALKCGFLFQGQYYRWQRKRRGTPAWGLPKAAFVHYLENHDQVGNAPGSARLIERSAPGDYRAMLTVLLLGPETPLLFQGQELGLRSPFHYFADHDRALEKDVHEGRRAFMAQFASQASPDAQGRLPSPSAEETRRACVLDRSKADPAISALVRDLLRLRREDPTFRARGRLPIDGAVLGPRAFCLRWAGSLDGDDDRLLVVNLGAELEFGSLAEPLVAPPFGCRWEPILSSEDPEYGGGGIAPLERPGWALPAHFAAALRPVEGGPARRTA